MATLLTSRLFIDHLRFCVHDYRYHRREIARMALELKGLKAGVSRLKGNIDTLNTIVGGANEKAEALISHVTDIGSQIGEHVEDVEFAAGTLGNSSRE